MTVVIGGGMTRAVLAASLGLERVLDDGLIAGSSCLFGLGIQLIKIMLMALYSFFMMGIKN